MSDRVLEAGELVLLHDRVGRTYRVRLDPAGRTSLHSGYLEHDQLVGSPEGTVVTTSQGSRLLAVRPTLPEQIVSNRRVAQPIYPKDLGVILALADVRPGLQVLEAGTGTGALALTLARAVSPGGSVVSYEVRPEFQERAAAAITEWDGSVPANLELRLGDVSEVHRGERFDRVCLDLPQPWEAVEAAHEVLRPGGILFAHCPNLSQIQRLHDRIREARGFGLLQTTEVIQRGWVVRERSLRPMHRMVAHTGFLFFARRIQDGLLFETESEGFQ